MVIGALKEGVRGLRGQGRMAATFFAANLALALLTAWPMSNLLDSFAGHRLQGAGLAEGIDFNFVVELLQYEHQAVASILSLALPAAGGAVLLSLFLSGGALSIFAAHRSFSAQAFWGASARHFAPVLRLFLWCLLPPVVVLVLLAALSAAVGLLTSGDAYQSTWYWVLVAEASLAALALMLTSLFFDYGRLWIVLNGDRRARRALVEGIRFTLGRLPQTVGLGVALLLMGIAGAGLFKLVVDRLDAPRIAAVWGLILLQQIYILWRTTLRLTRYGAELALFRQLGCEQNACEPAGGQPGGLPAVAPPKEFPGE